MSSSLKTSGFGEFSRDGCKVTDFAQDSTSLTIVLNWLRTFLAAVTLNPMTIESTQTEKAVVLKIIGRMDADSVNQFESCWQGLIGDGVLHVIADLNELRYVNSMGLRSFLSAAQALQARSGSLILCGLKGVPRQVFEMTNLLSIFRVFETSGEAIAAL
jgi:anti-anti-sigma factor